MKKKKKKPAPILHRYIRTSRLSLLLHRFRLRGLWDLFFPSISSPLGYLMGLSKTEVNLRRLLAAALQQHNLAKLIHYVTTLRKLLEQLGAETTANGISSISKAKLKEYSEKIEALAVKLASPLPEPGEVVAQLSIEESPSRTEEASGYTKPSPGLRRRLVGRTETEDATHEHAETDSAMRVKLDATAHAHIEKHRKLQEDLTDEMVVLARQLKESSLMMNQSLHDSEKEWHCLDNIASPKCKGLLLLTWAMVK